MRLPGHLQAGPGPQRPVGRVGTSFLFPLWVGMFFPESIRLCPHCRALSIPPGSVHTTGLRPHHRALSTPLGSGSVHTSGLRPPYWAPFTQFGSIRTTRPVHITWLRPPIGLRLHNRAPLTLPSFVHTAERPSHPRAPSTPLGSVHTVYPFIAPIKCPTVPLSLHLSLWSLLH